MLYIFAQNYNQYCTLAVSVYPIGVFSSAKRFRSRLMKPSSPLQQSKNASKIRILKAVFRIRFSLIRIRFRWLRIRIRFIICINYTYLLYIPKCKKSRLLSKKRKILKERFFFIMYLRTILIILWGDFGAIPWSGSKTLIKGDILFCVLLYWPKLTKPVKLTKSSMDVPNLMSRLGSKLKNVHLIDFSRFIH